MRNTQHLFSPPFSKVVINLLIAIISCQPADNLADYCVRQQDLMLPFNYGINKARRPTVVLRCGGIALPARKERGKPYGSIHYKPHALFLVSSGFILNWLKVQFPGFFEERMYFLLRLLDLYLRPAFFAVQTRFPVCGRYGKSGL